MNVKKFLFLLRNTWWLWLAFIALTVFLIVRVNLIFIVMIPILIGVFIYFALVRYDDDGNFLGS